MGEINLGVAGSGSDAVLTSPLSEVNEVSASVDAAATKSDRIFRLVCAIAGVLLLVTIGLIATVVNLSQRISNLDQSIVSLDQKTNDTIVEQQTQIDGLSQSIDGVRADMEAGFASQQEQIDRTKQIQSATNKAFTRFQKQCDQTETELREELKKD